jgi:hypothetical protein
MKSHCSLLCLPAWMFKNDCKEVQWQLRGYISIRTVFAGHKTAANHSNPSTQMKTGWTQQHNNY